MGKRDDELLTLAEDTIALYATRDTNWDEIEDYYFLEGDQDPTDNDEDEIIEIVRLPYVTNTVDLVQDLFAAIEWSVTVPALGEKPSDQDLADNAEAYLEAVYRQSERAQRVDLLSRAAWLLAMRGCLAGRVMVVKDWLAKEKEGESERLRVGSKVPLLIQLRDPRYVYPELGLDGLSFVVERFTRKASDIRRVYGKSALPDNTKDSQDVEWTEYWDDTHYAYWADGEVVKGKTEHGYGGIPYAFEFSRQTGKSEPEKRARSFLQGALDVVDRMNTLASMEHTFIGHYVGTSWAWTSEGASDVKMDLRPGAVNRLQPGDRIEPIQAGRQPMEMQQAWQQLQTHWERATFPGTVFGMDPGRVMSGYSLNLLNQSGRTRLQPMIVCMQRFLESLFASTLMVSENYLAPLHAGPLPFYTSGTVRDSRGRKRAQRSERKFKADNLGGVYFVDVSLGDLLPQDEQANMTLALQARTPGVDQRPLLSDETTREKYLNQARDADERDRIDRQLTDAANPEIKTLKDALWTERRKQEMEKEVKATLKMTPEEVLVTRVGGGEPIPPASVQQPAPEPTPEELMMMQMMAGQQQPGMTGEEMPFMPEAGGPMPIM